MLNSRLIFCLKRSIIMTYKFKWTAFLPAVFGLLLTIGVLTVFSACGMKDDGTWMHCHAARNAVALCGAVITVLLALAAFMQNQIAKVVLNAAALVGAVVAFLIPGNIMPMCMMTTMRCYSVMQPFVRIMTVIIAAASAAGIFRAVRTGER